LHREWEDGECTRPSITYVKRLFFGVYKWSVERVYSAWEEVGDFWRSGLLLNALS